MSHKTTGVVFTPQYISDFMSLFITDQKVTKLKILEPSCGEGVFINSLLKLHNEFELYVNDINSSFIKTCIKNNKKNTNITYYNKDFITFDKSIKYDIIIGNPPYVRIQNLRTTDIDKIKSEYNILSGNLDLYIYFLLKCVDMLTDNGKLIFIIPNSFLFNKSCSKIKQQLLDLKYVEFVIDFKEYKVFNGFSTYTCIIVINKSIHDRDFYYYKAISSNNIKYELNNITYIEKKYTDNIDNTGKKCLLDYINVKCGLATLCDNIYIPKIDKEDDLFIHFTKDNKKYKVEKTIVKKLLKVSKNTEYYIIVPYDNLGKIYDTLDNFPHCSLYLSDYKQKLSERDKGKKTYEKWYAFGRKQGLNYRVNETRLFISSIVKNIKDNLIEKIIPLFYSGLFIEIKEEYKNTISIQQIKKVLLDFELDILNKCNCKSGGYYTINKESFNIYIDPIL